MGNAIMTFAIISVVVVVGGIALWLLWPSLSDWFSRRSNHMEPVYSPQHSAQTAHQKPIDQRTYGLKTVEQQRSSFANTSGMQQTPSGKEPFKVIVDAPQAYDNQTDRSNEQLAINAKKIEDLTGRLTDATTGLSHLFNLARQLHESETKKTEIETSYKELTRKYDSASDELESLKPKYHENETKKREIENSYKELTSKYNSASGELESLRPKYDELIERSEMLQKKLEEAESATNRHKNSCDEKSAKIEKYERWFPVFKYVEVFGRAQAISCALENMSEQRVQFFYARLALLLAALNMDQDPSSKSVVIRDAFIGFDSELYSLLFSDVDTLSKVRKSLEEILKPMVQQYLVFHWPDAGDTLNRKIHKVEEESGKEHLAEVKSAVLETPSGALIAMASVRT